MSKPIRRTVFALILLVLFSGCTTVVVNYVIDPTFENLQQQTDLNLVCEGAPSFLLIIDSLIVSNPQSLKMLMAGTQAYASYTAVLAECNRDERMGQLSLKAKKYGLTLLGLFPKFKENMEKPVTEFENAISGFNKNDVDALFWGGYGWATNIMHQDGSPAALADLLKIEQIMLKVVELEDTYYNGAAHLFLGVYYGSRPSMYGGQPEKSRQHFEKALAISNHQFLAVQVAFAENYARMTFDRDLYGKLLQEVVDFPLESRPELSLTNQVAKRKARRLLDQIDDFF
ncbi:MAG: TRAP transporter TatT component family protein [Proteobacteria bacterium]|nr:TRAP transporter TatT component family protein [Pseudomonadota bacterium]